MKGFTKPHIFIMTLHFVRDVIILLCLLCTLFYFICIFIYNICMSVSYLHTESCYILKWNQLINYTLLLFQECFNVKDTGRCRCTKMTLYVNGIPKCTCTSLDIVNLFSSGNRYHHVLFLQCLHETEKKIKLRVCIYVHLHTQLGKEKIWCL